MTRVRFKKLSKAAVTPSQATPGSNGFDLTALEVEVVTDPQGHNNHIVCKTGIALEIPYGYVGILCPRSSISRLPLSLSNNLGVIDSDYRGELILKFRFSGQGTTHWERNIYKAGDRVGQLLIVPSPAVELVEVVELEDTIRGSGGFGSTDEPRSGAW